MDPHMDEEFREKVARERERDRIREAIWARQFTPQQTLAMGFDLIDFAIKFNKEAKFEQSG